MIDLFHQGMIRQILHHFFGIFRVPLQSQGQGFHTLQQQEGVEGRDGRAGVSQENGPDVGDKSGRTHRIHKGDSMIAGVGFGNGRILSGGLPVKFAGVHDDASQGGAVTADKLGGGMDHDIRAVFDGTDQIGGTKGVVNDQRNLMSVGNGG